VEIHNWPSLWSCQAPKPPLTWARAVKRSGVTTWALARSRRSRPGSPGARHADR